MIVIYFIIFAFLSFFFVPKLFNEKDIPTNLSENEAKEKALIFSEKGERIKAIKILRKNLGMDLKQSVDFLNNSINNSSLTDEQLRQQILDLLKNGKKIEAIKIVREHRGLELKLAKEFVETIDK